jgi:hypothetical protein
MAVIAKKMAVASQFFSRSLFRFGFTNGHLAAYVGDRTQG